MKAIAVFTALLCFALSCASLSSYIDKRPEVIIKDFDIIAVSFRDIDLKLDVEIKNPYPVGLKLEKVKFKVDIENNQLFSTTTTSGFNIRASGAMMTPLAVNMEYSKIMGIVKDYRNKEYLTCTVSGELVIPLPKIPGLPPTYTYPFKTSRKIPAIKPSISIANFKVKAPGARDIENAIKKSARNLDATKIAGVLGGILSGKSVSPVEVGLDQLDLKFDVTFDIHVKNETKTKINFDKLSYDFSINNEKVFQGDSTNTRSAGDTLIVKVTNSLSTKSLSKGVLDIFKVRKGAFKIRGGTYINLPAEIKKAPLKLEFDESGNFGL